MLKTMLNSVASMFDNVQAVICGIFTAILGYLFPVKDVVHLLLLLFILDVIFGYWAAYKLRQERFNVKIIWEHTIPRMLISVVLIVGAFMWDDVFNQTLVCSYKIIGWFISGVLLYSIAENGYQITKWSVFPKLGELIRGKIKGETGMDVNEEKPKDNGTDGTGEV